MKFICVTASVPGVSRRGVSNAPSAISEFAIVWKRMSGMKRYSPG